MLSKRSWPTWPASNVLPAVIAAFLLTLSVCAQASGLDTYVFPAPAFAADLTALKRSDPKMTADALAKAANDLIRRRGLPFSFVVDQKTCEKLAASWAARKPTDPPLSVSISLESIDGDRALLKLPPPVQIGDTVRCSVEVPVVQVTGVDFVTVIDGRNVKFRQPANFYPADAILLDTETLSKIQKRWRMPVRGVPLGVSADGSTLFAAFKDPELKDLAIAVAGDGTFSVVTRAEAVPNGQVEPVPDNKGATASTDVSSFIYPERSFVIRYPKP